MYHRYHVVLSIINILCQNLYCINVPNNCFKIVTVIILLFPAIIHPSNFFYPYFIFHHSLLQFWHDCIINSLCCKSINDFGMPKKGNKNMCCLSWMQLHDTFMGTNVQYSSQCARRRLMKGIFPSMRSMQFCFRISNWFEFSLQFTSQEALSRDERFFCKY